jgi:hypothetical protein
VPQPLTVTFPSNRSSRQQSPLTYNPSALDFLSSHSLTLNKYLKD